MSDSSDGMQCAAVARNRQPFRQHEYQTCDCKGRRWTCKGCKRFVPWCNGGHAGDPETDDLCDQCWSVVDRQRRDGLRPVQQERAR